MVLSSLYMILFLLVLMVGSVVLARYAQARQEGNVIRLYRLAALDRRRNETRAVIRSLQEVDDNAETLRILNQALKADLVRIQKLDPARADIEQEIRQASAAPAAGAADAKGDKSATDARGAKVEKRTSLSSERDVQRVRGHISEAMAIIRRLYQSNQVRAEQLESTATASGHADSACGREFQHSHGGTGHERCGIRKGAGLAADGGRVSCQWSAAGTREV
jgi:hypothetical protein